MKLYWLQQKACKRFNLFFTDALQFNSHTFTTFIMKTRVDNWSCQWKNHLICGRQILHCYQESCEELDAVYFKTIYYCQSIVSLRIAVLCYLIARKFMSASLWDVCDDAASFFAVLFKPQQLHNVCGQLNNAKTKGAQGRSRHSGKCCFHACPPCRELVEFTHFILQIIFRIFKKKKRILLFNLRIWEAWEIFRKKVVSSLSSWYSSFHLLRM